MDVVPLMQASRALRIVLLDMAEAVDAWRMAPRAFVFFYLYQLHAVTQWYMGKADPTTAQTTFTTAIWGFLIPLLTWYFSTGRKWGSAPAGASQ